MAFLGQQCGVFINQNQSTPAGVGISLGEPWTQLSSLNGQRASEKLVYYYYYFLVMFREMTQLHSQCRRRLWIVPPPASGTCTGQGRAGPEGSWGGQILLFLSFSKLQIHWHKGAAWSSWETGLGVDKALNAFALKGEWSLMRRRWIPVFFPRHHSLGSGLAQRF